MYYYYYYRSLLRRQSSNYEVLEDKTYQGTHPIRKSVKQT